MTTTETAARNLQDASPEAFHGQVLFDEPYGKQIEMMEAVGSSRRVAVAGCNSSGKDWEAARIALWWLWTRYPSKVIITGPTHRQVEDIVFQELRSAFTRADPRHVHGLGGRLFEQPRYEINQEQFILGFSTDRPFNLQGFHSPHLLVIVSEAHAMGESHIVALRRLNPECMLMTGNPFVQAGVYFDAFHADRDRWSTINIGAWDTPNLAGNGVVVEGMVTEQDVEDRKDEWGEDNPLYIAGVLGQFPDSLDDTVVPLYAVTAASERQSTPAGPIILGCDVARFGRDKTVVVRRQGDVARIVYRTHGRDTMQIAGWLGAYLDDHREVDALVVDDTGVGGGVVDRLREVGTGRAVLVPFSAGSKANQEKRFVNRTSEVWWATRVWLLGEDSKADIDNDMALIGQLSARGYSYQSDKRIEIESKKKMLKSPDEADALVMTFDSRAAVMGKSTLVRERKQSVWTGVQ